MKKKLIKDKLNTIYRNLDENIFSQFNSKNVLNSLNSSREHLVKKIQNKHINPALLTQKIQDKIESLLTNDVNQIVLKQSKFWTSTISWSLISGSLFAIGWLSIAKTEEIVIALGKLEPAGGVVDVQMPIEGIAREILVKEGEKVVKGQTLILLDTEITEARNTSLQESLFLNNKMLNQMDVLLNEGAVSEFQYLQQKLKITEITQEIKSNMVKLKYQKILSPISGKVFELKPKGPGYVARTSEPVLKIVPLNALEAKVEIDSRSIGFVKTGKLAEISIDSYPATDFGVVEGEVISISSDALPPSRSEGKGYRFPAKISLDKQYLELKTGEKLNLQPGMSLSANIKLRKVTYLQLLFSKFGSKANSLKSI